MFSHIFLILTGEQRDVLPKISTTFFFNLTFHVHQIQPLSIFKK